MVIVRIYCERKENVLKFPITTYEWQLIFLVSVKLMIPSHSCFIGLCWQNLMTLFIIAIKLLFQPRRLEQKLDFSRVSGPLCILWLSVLGLSLFRPEKCPDVIKIETLFVRSACCARVRTERMCS